MIQNNSTTLLSLSDRVYRLLLALYPADYRDEYGPHMAQVFRDMCRDAYQRDGAWGVLGSWLPVLLDLAITALEERRKEGIRMPQFTFARWSGLITIIGGLLFMAASFSQLQPGSHGSFYGVYQLAVTMIAPAIFLVALGLVGIRVQFRTRMNLSGKWALNFTIVALTISGLSFLGSAVVSDLYTVFIPAFFGHLVGILLLGFSTVRTKLLPRWNTLPVLIGLIPFLWLLTGNRGIVYGPQYVAFASIGLMGLGYVLLGYLAHSDASARRTATVADSLPYGV